MEGVNGSLRRFFFACFLLLMGGCETSLENSLLDIFRTWVLQFPFGTAASAGSDGADFSASSMSAVPGISARKKVKGR